MHPLALPSVAGQSNDQDLPKKSTDQDTTDPKSSHSSVEAIGSSTSEPSPPLERPKNHAPIIIGDTINNTVVSITENEMIGRMVAVVSSSDPDGDIVSVHLLPKGNEESTFALVEGAVTVAKRIDYERQSKYDLTLVLHDGIESTFFNVSIRE